MLEKTKEYRKELAELFIKVLEEKELDWKKEWTGKSKMPINAKSKARYKGINRFWLMLIARVRGYEDPRWATFNQIKDLGCSIKNAKGQGVRVEYWFPYDRKECHNISWDEFYLRTKGQPDGRYTLRAVYSTVFNAALISGLPELPKVKNEDISIDRLVETLSKNMEVEIINHESDEAYYRPSEDKIYLPNLETFHSEYAYNSTALHELAHATGASHRLNRKMGGFFGSPEYAYEELIAEISSCFMSGNLQEEQDEQHIQNHRAYVQSWIKRIREKPETLIKAVAEAERTASYMEYKAKLIAPEEYEQIVSSVSELQAGKPKPPLKKEPAARGPKL